jgi:8-oxo-dGTP diphosphatase
MVIILHHPGEDTHRKMTKVDFFDPMFEPECGLTYSVIAARYENRWIFVRHRNRDTWEIAGGHIEVGETSFDAARRELAEETGALEFGLYCIATYSVTISGQTGYGRLYYADIYKIGVVPDVSEIAETIQLDQLPSNLTYPDIQLVLFEKTLEYFSGHHQTPVI